MAIFTGFLYRSADIFQNFECRLPILPFVTQRKGGSGMDIVYLAGIVLLFGVSAALAAGCAKLEAST